ncbi:unnamed protein product [Amoebophrya sp. A25]|nr:unnamed protein product [Amoebophrya sp. A25]|eukprot:GSA25T00023564001.1
MMSEVRYGAGNGLREIAEEGRHGNTRCSRRGQPSDIACSSQDSRRVRAAGDLKAGAIRSTAEQVCGTTRGKRGGRVARTDSGPDRALGPVSGGSSTATTEARSTRQPPARHAFEGSASRQKSRGGAKGNSQTAYSMPAESNWYASTDASSGYAFPDPASFFQPFPPCGPAFASPGVPFVPCNMPWAAAVELSGGYWSYPPGVWSGSAMSCAGDQFGAYGCAAPLLRPSVGPTEGHNQSASGCQPVAPWSQPVAADASGSGVNESRSQRSTVDAGAAETGQGMLLSGPPPRKREEYKKELLESIEVIKGILKELTEDSY